jgi:hypothetical protein
MIMEGYGMRHYHVQISAVSSAHCDKGHVLPRSGFEHAIIGHQAAEFDLSRPP